MADRIERRLRVALGILAGVGVIGVGAGAAWQGERRQEDTRWVAASLTGGDPDLGRAAIERYGCGSCHTIPGVRGADANVGPSLQKLAGRTYVAGVLPNTPANLTRWIQDPPAVDDKTAMPNLGITEHEARDIAAYLYTLK
jgi:cytochrome c